MSTAHTETVLVTGASSGIGLELVKCFATDGCRLILVARNTGALETLAKELRQAHGIETLVLTADLSRPETPKRIFNELQNAGIAVDVLVNNAGFGAHGAFVEMSLPWQLEMLQVNIAALTELTGLFLPGMIARRRGGILNVGSVLCPGPTTSNFGNVARGNKVRRLNTSKMSAEAVARHGHRAFRNGKVTAVPGIQNHLLIFLNRIAPRWFPRKIVKLYNRTD